MFNQKKNLNNILGGQKAKSNGDRFELLLQKRCAQEKISFIKIPSGCRFARGSFGVQPIPIKTPFDFIIAKDGKAVFFDAKCLSNSSLTYSKIKPHQLEKLFEMEQQSFLSGYIVYFVEENKVSFFTSSTLKKLPPRHSLEYSDGVILGNIENFNLLPLLQLVV